MKKLALVLLLIALCLSVTTVYADNAVRIFDGPSEVVLLQQTTEGMNVEVELGGIDLLPVQTKDGDYILISSGGLTRSHNIGEPSLPLASKLISIPFGCELKADVISFEMEEISLVDHGISLQLMPVQPSLSKSDDADDIPFEKNNNLYQTAGYYELPLVETEILGVMRDKRIARLAIAPIQYNPTENKIKVYRNIVVNISYENPDWNLTEEMHSNFYSPFFEQAYGRIFNYITSENAQRDDLVTYPVKYVIVSDRMFEAQLAPFIEWKTKKGFDVVVGYTDVIGTSNAAIKTFIQDLYNAGTPQDPAPSFVLFVGDDQQISAWSGDAGSHITDLKFCEFTGDIFPEIYYGRFSAQNTSLLQPQIDKTLEYEQYLMPDPSYLAEVTLIAGVDASWAPTHGNGQINYGTTLYFNAAHGIFSNTYLYPDSDAPGAAAAIIQHVDDGIGFMNYTAHCGHEGFSDPSFEVSDIEGLTNDHMWLLAIGNCCLPNTFGSSYGTPCFGESFLQEPNKGGIGFIGGTNSTYWDEDYWWGVGNGPVVSAGPTYAETGLGAYDGIFHDHGEDVSQHYISNSAIIFAGNLAVSESGSSRENYYWEIYHVMGDPSITSYMGLPTANAVVHDNALIMTAPSITVTADPYSYIAITMDGVIHGVAYVGVSGSATISLTAFDAPGVADIVVTCQNKIPYISTIQIVAPQGPYVIYDSHDINDATGNNDGFVDAGENISLGLTVKNVGPDDALNVVANLISTDIYVTLNDAQESYGTILGNEGTGYVADAFNFDIDPNCPDGHNVMFELSVSGDERDVWSSNFSIPVHAPDVVYVSVTIDDAAGNANGILDPNETADIIVTIENSGTGAVSTVTGTLSESDQFVDVTDNSGSFGDMLGSSTADNGADVFTASADIVTPMGHEMSFNLAISSATGYSTNLSIPIIVGDRVVIFEETFSFPYNWTGLGGSGEWTIGSPLGGSSGNNADPTEDHTPNEDNQVLGNDLTTNGAYNSNISGTHWVTSPIIDCSAVTGVLMKYYHWNGVESPTYDHLYFQVNDGSSWITIWENTAAVSENSWNEANYDLSAYADNNPDFQMRFGIGPTDGSAQYCGWNIDDIELKGYGESQSGDAIMALDPAEFTDSLVQGEMSNHWLNIANSGDGLLRVRFTSPDSWITFSPDQQQILPDDQIPFQVIVDAATLPVGNNVGTLNYTSNDENNASGSIDLNVHIFAPQISVAVDSIIETLSEGESSSVPLIINNTGPGLLTWSISTTTDDKGFAKATSSSQELLGYRVSDPDKSLEKEPYYSPSLKGSGGPDLFGYSWIDSDETGGPTYQWVDISGTGTEVSLGDDNSVGPIPIGFSFPYYENNYTDLYIGSNGFLTFGTGSGTAGNDAIPDAGTPNDILSIWWDDIDPPEGNGAVYYYYDLANARFIVSFVDVRNYVSPSGTGSLTFQAILYPNGDITYNYDSMDPGADAAGLAGATIGIENSTGTDGLQVVYNAAYMHDYLTVEFSSSARWLTVMPGGGSVAPGASDTVDVNLDATEIVEGIYTGTIAILSNDPGTMSVPVEVLLNVGAGGQAAMLCTPDSLADTIIEGDPCVDSLQITNNGTATLRVTFSSSTFWLAFDDNEQVIPVGQGIIYYVTADTDSLIVGEHVGVLNFTSNDPANLTGSIPIVVTVSPSALIGDCDGSGEVDISDAVYIIAYVFQGGPAPDPIIVGDVDCSGEVDVSDAVYLISFIFQGGPAPCNP